MPRRFLNASLLTALLALGCHGATGPDPNARDEIVVYVDVGLREADLYAVSADGARSRQLTNAPGQELDPEVSPDGQRIAFLSDRDGNYEIYVMGADGSDIVRITNDPGFDVNPTWLPDGQRLAFVSDRSGEAELYTVNADGTGLTRLTTNTVLDLSPHWSPDGNRIVLSRDRDERPGDIDLYLLNNDGTSPIRLTETRSTQESKPKWSPDGGRIAFITDTVINLVSGGHVLWAISVIDANGSNRDQLTSFSSATQGFTWSPDGTRIIFDQQDDLWAVNVRDKSVTRLTNTPTIAEAAPSWRRVP